MAGPPDLTWVGPALVHALWVSLLLGSLHSRSTKPGLQLPGRGVWSPIPPPAMCEPGRACDALPAPLLTLPRASQWDPVLSSRGATVRPRWGVPRDLPALSHPWAPRGPRRAGQAPSGAGQRRVERAQELSAARMAARGGWRWLGGSVPLRWGQSLGLLSLPRALGAGRACPVLPRTSCESCISRFCNLPNR